MTRLFKSLFHFLSSLKLAVVVLVTLSTVLGYGTYLESTEGAVQARVQVYGTLWFTLLLVFLGVNVLCAALSRLPWKRQHIGFLITHLGILTVLLGGGITRLFGVEGVLQLQQGEVVAERTMQLTDVEVLSVTSPDFKEGSRHVWTLDFLSRPPSPERPWQRLLEDGTLLTVDLFYPRAAYTPEIVENPNGRPALHLLLTQLPDAAGGSREKWLFHLPAFEESFDVSSKLKALKASDLGPARILFLKEEDFNSLKTFQDAAIFQSFLQLYIPEHQLTVPIPLQKILTEKEFPIAGTNFTFKLFQFLPDARVREGALANVSDLPRNPLLQFEIIGKDVAEKQTVLSEQFLKEGEGGGVQMESSAVQVAGGQKASGMTAKLLFHLPSKELYLKVNSSGEIFYRILDGENLGPVTPLSLNQETPTGWMTIHFQVERFLPKAAEGFRYEPVALPRGKKEEFRETALRFTLQKGATSLQSWVGKGGQTGVTWDDRSQYSLHYNIFELPFELRLKSFKVLTYPGTNKAQDYESLVELTPIKRVVATTGSLQAPHLERRPPQEAKIVMNQPHYFQGYKIYQTSFDKTKDGVWLSTLSITKDPGINVKYVGSIILVSGIILMFWFRPVFKKKEK